MAIDTNEERIGILAWPDSATLPDAAPTIDADERLVILAIPIVDTTTLERIKPFHQVNVGVGVGV